MAALIHLHHPPFDSAASSPPSHLLKSSTPIKITCFLSPSKTPLSLSSPKPQLFSAPPFLLSKTPPFEHLHTPKLPDNIQPLSNDEISRLLKLSREHGDVQLGKAVHASIIKFRQDIRLCNSLITSYIELGHLSYAERVFHLIAKPDVVSYTALISGLAKSGRGEEAVALFLEMRVSGIEPNAYAFVAILTACMRLLDLGLGSQIHALSIKTGHANSSYVANAVMGLYGKSGCFDFVIKLFDEMPERDIASWNTVISCVVKEGLYGEAFELFYDMLVEMQEGCRADYFTLSSLLIACARFSSSSSSTMYGKGIHAYAVKTGYGGNLSVRNALIQFYAKCGCVEDVEDLFGSMPARDGFTWTEMVSAYMGFGRVGSALEVFCMMPEKNSIAYNALLAGFCQNGDGSRALRFFCRMVEEGVELTDFTLSSALHACGLSKHSRFSKQMQAFVVKIGSGTNEYIQAALLDMCTRCARMGDAEKIFHQLPLKERSSIMLTTMVCGYARHAELEKAISLINEEEQHIAIDEVALASTLGVCGDLGFQTLGEQFHCRAIKHGSLSDVGVGNAIVSMYSKCGDMERAMKVFNSMPEHDIVSWNCVLSGHILNRQGEMALDAWKKMLRGGIRPDTVTCVLIISAYRHTKSKLVEQCLEFFLSMKRIHNVEPNSEHYASLVGVYGFWGLLEAAEKIIKKMPFEATASVWKALLDSCRLHRNATIGGRAAKEILRLEPQDPSTYILKSNLYSASGRWHCSDLVREEMKSKGLRKFPGRSWLIHENKVHSFFGRDKSHPETKDIYSALEILFMECSRSGYTPDTSFVLHEVEEHQKTNFLLYHSGKLAVAYGLLVTGYGKPVRVSKNIHVCGDCHTFFKYVSVVTKREIHVRDASGFHCFLHGECSCCDHW
ncbi:pentatricopeptide repeat-containing protein At5g03800 [Salvia miltiorrhiza]|uniref:pentatricopeptide repeat-containing protein At5g03800 n=1 Tax=Salvia miltiorrhiza TaxID=226208 RepID=UPI0025AD567C|nr:pentatricopeptide repeat-containing protein At5g03800 [Salvia miltiorrhiza]